MKGIVVLMFDGLMYGCGDVMIGINLVIDSFVVIVKLFVMIDGFCECYGVLI